jgi:hypothetical protein
MYSGEDEVEDSLRVVLSASPIRLAAILAASAAADERDGRERGAAWHRLLDGADREPE